MALSERMKAVADMAERGLITADVGTDHAYIPIYLVKNGIIPSAIAMDLREGPLKRAAADIAVYGLEDRIKTRLSDGLHSLSAGEAQAVIISGMGGLLILKILSEGKAVLDTVQELILQPQSDTVLVRHFLYDNGFIIDKENMVCDAGKYYQVFRAVHMRKDIPERSRYSDEADFRYGKLLIDSGNEVLRSYLEFRIRKLREIEKQLRDHGKAGTRDRYDEIHGEISVINEALRRFPAEADS